MPMKRPRPEIADRTTHSIPVIHRIVDGARSAGQRTIGGLAGHHAAATMQPGYPPSNVLIPSLKHHLLGITCSRPYAAEPFRQCPTNVNAARYPQPMSERPVTKSAHAESDEESSPRSLLEQTVARPGWSDASRWPTYAALAIAVIAVVLAALAYFHPAHKAASEAQQGGDAKANVCSAYAAAHKAVVINTHMQSPNPNDPIAELSVATNARLALIGSGAYLRDRIDANTAAPATSPTPPIHSPTQSNSWASTT